METEKRKATSRARLRERASLLPCGRPRPVHERPRGRTEKLAASLVERFESFCAREGLRTSHARRKIVDVIVEDLQHFTSQALASRLTRRYPEVGRATLYRTIPVLVKAGILQEGPKTLDGLPSYELAEVRHHDHIVCLDCSEVFEFSSARIEKEQDAIADGLDFRPQKHTHVIYAHCRRFERGKTGR